MNPLEMLGESLSSAFLTKERVEQLRKDFDGLEANFEELVDLVNDLNVRVARIEEREGLQKERVETALERFQLQVERFELRLRQLPPSSQ